MMRTVSFLSVLLITFASPARAQDASLVRHYVFDKIGDELPNLAGDRKGTLVVTFANPFFNKAVDPDANTDFPRWTVGRFGKPALEVRSAPDSVSNSQFYSTKTGVITIEGWVRLHETSDAAAEAVLFSVGSGQGKGWAIKATGAETVFAVGRPQSAGGDIRLSAPAMTPDVWHHIVAEQDKSQLRLYIDGALAGSRDFTGDVKQIPAPEGRFTAFPEEAPGGLEIGAFRLPGNRRFFDCDELAIADRIWSPGEIRSRFEAGRPRVSSDDQAKAHRAWLVQRDKRDRIQIDIPRDTFGYFTVGKPVPVTISLPPDAGFGDRLTVEATVGAWDEKPVYQGSKTFAPAEKPFLWELPFADRCGLFEIHLAVKDAAGEVLAERTFSVGSIVPVPPMAERSAGSPLAGYLIMVRHNESVVLGARTERLIPYIPKLDDGQPQLDDLEHAVELARAQGLDVMVCVQPYYDPPGITSANIPSWESWVRAIVERFKGRVKYWEIMNEPNAHQITPARYVEILKTAHQVIREVDPQAKIVGLCGVTTFPEWTEDVLAAGGGGYFDILSFHNYIGASPISAWRTQRKIERTRASLEKHLGKAVTMWNSECGIHQPRRVNGRPVTDDELLQLYPRGRRQDDGIVLVPADAITLATERVGASWQTQSILLDSALGAEKWFILMGASYYYPQPGASAGLPSLKGVSFAALASVVSDFHSATLIPMEVSTAAGVMVRGEDGKRTAALFADIPATRSFVVNRNGKWRGMDYLGNPLEWEARNNLLTVSFGIEPVYIFDAPEDFREAAFLQIKNAPVVVSPGETVEGLVSVKNLYPSVFEGALKIVSPDSTVTYEPAVRLEPGAVKDVPFQLKAGPLSRGEHSLTASLLQGGAEIASTERSFASEGVARGIPLWEGDFALDANAAKWEHIPAEVADTERHVAIGRPPVGYYDPFTWQGPADLSFQVKTAWKPGDGIYFLIEVTDDAFQTVSAEDVGKAFLQDALELFFDGRPLSEQTPVYSAGAEQWVVVPSGSSVPERLLAHSFSRSGKLIDVEAVGKKTDKGYVMEGRIRPAKGSAFHLVPGTRVGMDFVIDDATEGKMTRKTQMALHGGSDNAQDTSGFGRYFLMDRPAEASENLLKNSLLETPGGGSVPGWTFHSETKGSEARGAREMDGAQALWIGSPEKIQNQSWWYQVVPAEGERAYAVSCKVKGRQTGRADWASAACGVYFLGAGGKWLGYQAIGEIKPTGEWGTLGGSVLTPTGTEQMGFRFATSSKGVEGKVDFYCTDMAVTREQTGR